MRIGLPGGGSTVDRMIEQAKQAEADGFTSIWYASAVAGDPLVAMAVAGHGTTTIELGTVGAADLHDAIPRSWPTGPPPWWPAMGRPGFTLGIGPSHEPVIAGMHGLDFSHPGRHTEEYVDVLAPLLRGEAVTFDGEDFRRQRRRRPPLTHGEIPVLVAALGPRLLRVAGEQTAGTILWMANAQAVETHVAPRIRGRCHRGGTAGAPDRGRACPSRCTTTSAEARGGRGHSSSPMYGTLPNYQRILAHGGVEGPADAAIVGDEASVAGADRGPVRRPAPPTCGPRRSPVGDDRKASTARTRALLKELTTA